MAANPALRPVEVRVKSVDKLFETIVFVSGPITLATAVPLRNKILDLIPQYRRIVLDLSNVDYVDCSGLGILVAAYTHAKGNHCEVEIANPKPRLWHRLRNWLGEVFEGHEEMLGMTPD